jgi:catechol 2,3-dioxygenase-like lactoylglutathione lyase family enzyme
MTHMTIDKLAHYSVRTRDLEASRRFYADLLGLRVGFRPPFEFPGLWLYRNEDETEFGVVHLIGPDNTHGQAVATYLGDKRSATSGTGAIDHVAFVARDWASFRKRCDRQGVRYVERTVPLLHLLQVFLTDPSGVTVELNYASSEKT